MKAYTTIEESEQLVKAGLDVNTADMCYIQTPIDEYRPVAYSLEYCNQLKQQRGSGMNLIPCWSLAALIELLPDYIEYWNKEGYFYDAFLEISKHAVAYRYFDRYQDIKIQLFEAFNESLVSSVSTTIIWLLENNYIKSNKNE